jgi:uridine kinase
VRLAWTIQRDLASKGKTMLSMVAQLLGKWRQKDHKFKGSKGSSKTLSQK